MLLKRALISPEDLSLYKLTDDVDVAVAEIVNFYRVYDSMRYVRDKLVLRLKADVGVRKLSRINAEFADILTDGRFELTDALPEERDETEKADLPRLAFQFNRRSLGRLRQLVDLLNADS
jgi:hypothetical protein